VALAGPPPGNSAGGLLSRVSGALTATPARSPANRLDFQNLDLRPPESLSGGRVSSSVGDSQWVFPSAKRAQLGTDTRAEEDRGVTPAEGAHWAALRMESPVQEMERRVPREGLPVARLWETKTALLHVGLSPKGKPGLWLTQKVP
jgi:hypothetical protein